jgi:hypothetical protein
VSSRPYFPRLLTPNFRAQPSPARCSTRAKIRTRRGLHSGRDVEQEPRDIRIADVTRKIVAHPGANRDEAPAPLTPAVFAGFPPAIPETVLPNLSDLRISSRNYPRSTCASFRPLGASLADSGLLGAHAHTTRIRSPSLDLKRILRVLASSGIGCVAEHGARRPDHIEGTALPPGSISPKTTYQLYITNSCRMP